MVTPSFLLGILSVISNVEEAELHACLAGLYIGITLRKAIILETDNSFVYDFLANEILDKSPLVDMKKETLGITQLIQSFKMVKIIVR